MWQISQNIWSSSTLRAIPFPFEVPSWNKFSEQAEEAYKYLSERFAERDIEGMLPYVGSWAGVLLKSWDKFCKDNDLEWSLDPEYIASSSTLGMALLFLHPDDSAKDIVDNKFYQLVGNSPIKSANNYGRGFEPGIDVFAVFWVHFIVAESWTLKNKITGDQMFISPEHHENHHIWRFAAQIHPQTTSWQVMDFDEQVRQRAMQLSSLERLVLDWKVNPITAWSQLTL